MDTSQQESSHLIFKNRCLICGSVILSKDIIKLAANTEEYTCNLDALFELLDLPSSVRSKAFTSKSGVSLFCSNCYLIVKDVAQLLEQIRRLQGKAKKVKNHLESLLHFVYQQEYSQADFNEILELRQLIVTEIRKEPRLPSPSSSNLNTSSVQLNRRRKRQLKVIPKQKQENLNHKQISNRLVNLTEDEVYSRSVPAASNSSSIGFKPYIDDIMNNDLESGSELDLNVSSNNDGTENGPNNVENVGSHDSDSLEWDIDSESELQSESEVPVRKRKRITKKVKGSKLKRKKPNEMMKSIKCSECDEVFSSELNQKAHIRACHEVDIELVCPFYCATCKRRFFTNSGLEVHLENQEGGICTKQPIPEYCSYVTGHGHKQFKCNECNCLFRDVRSVEAHYSTVHSKEEKYMCDICGHDFKSKTALSHHKTRYHYDGAFEDHPFKCTYKDCSKVLSNPAQLKIHQKVHRGEYKFLCTKCEYRAVTIARLNSHYKDVHNMNKPKCEQCGKLFAELRSLQNHIIQIHTDPEHRPFPCGYCTKSFPSQWKLKRHQSIHTGEKSIDCKICGRTFANGEYLTSHVKKVHKDNKEQLDSILGGGGDGDGCSSSVSVRLLSDTKIIIADGV